MPGVNPQYMSALNRLVRRRSDIRIQIGALQLELKDVEFSIKTLQEVHGPLYQVPKESQKTLNGKTAPSKDSGHEVIMGKPSPGSYGKRRAKMPREQYDRGAVQRCYNDIVDYLEQDPTGLPTVEIARRNACKHNNALAAIKRLTKDKSGPYKYYQDPKWKEQFGLRKLCRGIRKKQQEVKENETNGSAES